MWLPTGFRGVVLGSVVPNGSLLARGVAVGPRSGLPALPRTGVGGLELAVRVGVERLRLGRVHRLQLRC
jgi:hypothetical protein